jgi:hypothetical protein
MVSSRMIGGIAVVAATAAVTACAARQAGAGPAGTGSAGTAAQGPEYGTVTGRLVLEGGPLGPGGQQPPTRPLRGLVELIGPSGHIVRVRVGASGSFTVRLVPGTYRVVGRSPAVVEVSSASPGGKGREKPCTVPKTVTVSDQVSVSVTLACVVP